MIEDARVVGARRAIEHGSEAVHRQEQIGCLGTSPLELLPDSVMVRRKDLVDASGHLHRAQSLIAGHGDPSGHLRNRVFGDERTIAVDHKARVVLTKQDRVEFIGQELRNLGGPDVPSDMGETILGSHPQIAKRARQ